MCKVIEIPKIFAANGDHNIQSIKVFEGGNGCFIGESLMYRTTRPPRISILVCDYRLHILRTHSDPCFTHLFHLIWVYIKSHRLAAIKNRLNQHISL